MNVQEKETSNTDEQPLPPPLGWQLHYSSSEKMHYYFHPSSNHSQWTCPTKSEFDNPIAAKKKRDDAEAERTKRRAATRQMREEEEDGSYYRKAASQPSDGKSSLSSDDPITAPPGWRRYFSTKSRRHYYVHPASNHSQWTYPTKSEVADPIAAKKKRDDAEAERKQAELRRREEEAKEELRRKEEKDRELNLQQSYLAAIQKTKEEEAAAKQRQRVVERLAWKQPLAAGKEECTDMGEALPDSTETGLSSDHSTTMDTPMTLPDSAQVSRTDDTLSSQMTSTSQHTPISSPSETTNQMSPTPNPESESETTSSLLASLLASSTDQSTSSPTQSQMLCEEEFDIKNMPFTNMSCTKQDCRSDSCQEGYVESERHVESENQSTVISPSPVMDDTPASNSSIPPNETREDRIRREIEENKAILKAYEDECERELSDLRARSDLSHEEKVRLKGPALPKRKEESAQAPSDEYEWLRFHIIKKIIQCPDRHKVPMHARQCIEYLKQMSPGDVVVLWLNHCATQHSRGHCNLHAGNGSYKGADMYQCLTVKLMVAINERFGDITSFKCGEVAGDLQKGNIRECCLTLTEGFENCAPGTQDEAGALVAVTQIYLDGISDLDGHCAVASTAGHSSNMERLVLSKLKSKSERIRIAKFSTRHLQYAARPAPLLDVEESATRVTQEFERLDKEVFQPFLELIERGDVSFIHHVKSHPTLSFVTDHRDELAKQYTLSWEEEKNIRVNTILQACWDATSRDEDATVGSVVVAEGQENVILKYANNHCEELYKLPGADPTAKLEDFFVRDILRNMGRNGGKKCQELLRKKLGEERYSQLISAKGTTTWNRIREARERQANNEPLQEGDKERIAAFNKFQSAGVTENRKLQNAAFERRANKQKLLEGDEKRMAGTLTSEARSSALKNVVTRGKDVDDKTLFQAKKLQFQALKSATTQMKNCIKSIPKSMRGGAVACTYRCKSCGELTHVTRVNSSGEFRIQQQVTCNSIACTQHLLPRKEGGHNDYWMFEGYLTVREWERRVQAKRESLENDINELLLRRIRKFLKRKATNGGPTTQEVLREFDDLTDKDAVIFRKMLKSISKLKNDKWILQSK